MLTISTVNLTFCNNLLGSRRLESGTKAQAGHGLMQVGER